MAELLLAGTPERFTLVGLSLGGYVAFEILRRQPQRVERLALLDTTATADTGLRRAARIADIAKVLDGGLDALLPELPARYLSPVNAARPELVALMGEMAHNVGAAAQRNQQQAMLDRPDSHAGLSRHRRSHAGALRRGGSRRPGRRPRGDRLPHPWRRVPCRARLRPPLDHRAARRRQRCAAPVAGRDDVIDGAAAGQAAPVSAGRLSIRKCFESLMPCPWYDELALRP